MDFIDLPSVFVCVKNSLEQDLVLSGVLGLLVAFLIRLLVSNEKIVVEKDLERQDSEMRGDLKDEYFDFVSLDFSRIPELEMKKKVEDFYQDVKLRRSCQHFSMNVVPKEIIENIIRELPQVELIQPWFYVVVSSADVKAQLREIIEDEEEINYRRRMGKGWVEDLTRFKTNWIKPYLTEAPYLILLFREESGRRDNMKQTNYYKELSSAISAGFLLMAIHQAGLATVTTTPLNCGPRIRLLLQRPSNEKLILLFPVGYPADDAHAICRMAKKATESRRSTAAQFFMDEEITEPKSTYDRVVELINQASLLPKDNQKVNFLKQVQELIVHKESNLLDNFLDEMLAFQHDKSIEVRKFVVGKKDYEILPKVVANISMMLADDAVAVQKKVIQCSTQLYKTALKWLCSSKAITDIMESTWSYMNKLKSMILGMIDSDNDGVRTQVIKYMEMIIIVQTYPDPDVPKKENEIALDDIPLNIKILKHRKLEEDGKQVLDSLIVFQGSSHISNVNLMACMGTLTTIAKQRPEFMSKVIQTLEALQVNLPPTLAKSQVSSVRKHLKVQLLSLIKVPTSTEFHSQIITLLTDLGATQQEINKCLPRPEEMKKRSRSTDDSGLASKRMKMEVVDEPDDDKDEEEEEPQSKISRVATNTAIDITAEYLVPRLNTESVANLVLVSMMTLPDTLPAHFQASYTPIAAAGTDAQVKHVSRLLATQFTALGLGPGVEEMMKKAQKESEERKVENDGGSSPKHTIQTLVGRSVSAVKKAPVDTVTLLPGGQTKPSKRGIIQLKLHEITKPLPAELSKIMQESALKRILSADRVSMLAGVSNLRLKILAALAAQAEEEFGDLVEDFIFEDIRNRAELAFAWLYEEYCMRQGFNQTANLIGNPEQSKYDKVLCGFLNRLLSRPDNKDRETLFQRLYIEAPLITENAVEILKKFCYDESGANVGMCILKELIVKRPPKQMEFINVVLDLTAHEKQEIRSQAIGTVKQLYDRGEFRSTIEQYGLQYLKLLLLSEPPPSLFVESRGLPTTATQWTEEITKLCLYLYLALLPVNHKLIHDLAQVYVGTNANIKRIILRVLEAPVKGMGMGSPELLTLVENCPKGAETLVTRIIHILTDKAPPSAELVARVRDLYHKRVPDVRFLIPVLNGLTKKEVVAALPKLIQLNPVVVKEVFNRLLGGHGDSSANYTSPLTPAELLSALHNIDSTKCDMKTIIKATSLCFSEKHIYTQEVLAVVMQQLMEQNPLPTLLMRTVLQSLSLYPRLIGFVMNILQRLILKQVWKQKKVWEGFIKCCQRTKPQSFQVLLQLPPAQLQDVFDASPDLREPLLMHVNSFTEHQRAFIPKTIMNILIGPQPEEDEEEIDVKPVIVDEEMPLATSSIEALVIPPVIPMMNIVIKTEPPDEILEPAPPG
uniref:F-box domain-containing protein n=1 Tax=Strigamia maritima TaxID=126957 RepID=T1JDS4_STRMM